MTLLPAIDLIGGGAVRLEQGDFGRSTSYGNALDLARTYCSSGARWLHVVDLDAARTGDREAPNEEAIVGILGVARAAGVRVEVGGGVRRPADVKTLIDLGVTRVVLGTAAIEDPEFLAESAEEYPGRIALGVDYRRRADGEAEVAISGWLEGSGKTVAEFLAEVALVPLGAVIVTAIDRDGTLTGPDIAGLAAVLDLTAHPVVASGGVATVDDLIALRELAGPAGERRLVGAVVGKALVDGRIWIHEALRACTPSG